jgi:AAA15 family ATPase/GTPase
MLEKVGFENFLSLRDVKIDLEPFTVFVGPNASGKSTILEGIQRICLLKNPDLTEFLRYPRFIKNSKSIRRFSELLRKNAKSSDLSFLYLESKNNDNNEGYFSVNVNSESAYVELDNRILKDIRVDDYISIARLSMVFSTAISIKFSYEEAVKPTYSESVFFNLRETGLGLPTVFADLQNLKEEKYDLVQEKIRQVVPNLQKVKIKPIKVPASNWLDVDNSREHEKYIAEGRTARGHELLFDFTNALDIPASRVSEGTLFALTVLVAVASSEGDTAILIDDIERGLHPKAVKDLIRVLREIQKITPNLQIIATSHSPYVLHELEPKEVRVVNFDPELGTLVARLEDYPDFDKWRNEMTPGEFWSFVGEDWVTELARQKVST